LKLH